VYKASCATCHDNPEATRSPSKETLGKMSFQLINYALTRGKMQVQGQSLSDEKRASLINYLIGRNATPTKDWTQSMMCPTGRRKVDLAAGSRVATFGFDRNNTRYLSEAQAGLTKDQLSKLELAWSIAIPDATTMRAQGAIVGDTLFLPVADASAMYAFDISRKDPCIQWVYATPGGAPLRTSAAFGVTADGTPLLVFSGLDSTVYALDARTGKAIWTRGVGAYRFSLTTGTPTVLKDRIIVPVAQYEISVAAANEELCCTNHGYVLSLDPRTGDQQWRYDTMPEAKPVRDRGDGKMLWGPSGAPIWNSPVVDEKRGLVYFGTGEANSAPTHRNTNAIIAIRLKDGVEAWSHQATDRDIFLSGCGPRPGPEKLNCETDTVYRDVDFGASVILGKLKSGREVLFAGQKSGTVWALEPDTGKVIFQRDIGTGGPLGGIHWGIAFADDTIYAPISNPGRQLPGQPPLDPSIKAGVYAVDGVTGEIKWRFTPTPECAGLPAAEARICARGAAFSGAPTVIGETVVAGTLSGDLYVLDRRTGEPLWKTGTFRSYEASNGAAGQGGAIDGASIVAANGLLFVNSGYGMFGQQAGNMFLAFKPAGK
jgi:polyvinyl alcohol dehydrogenase (cytochrome)